MIVGFFAKQVAKRAARNKKLLNKISKKAMAKPGRTFTVKGSEAKALNRAFKSTNKMTPAQKAALAKAQKAAAIANRK